MIKFGCLVNMAVILVGFLGVSVLKVDLTGVAKEKISTLGFGLQVMLVGSLCVSFLCTLHISCETIPILD